MAKQFFLHYTIEYSFFEPHIYIDPTVFCPSRGEQAKKQALERMEAQAAQQAAMSAIEAENKKVNFITC